MFSKVMKIIVAILGFIGFGLIITGLVLAFYEHPLWLIYLMNFGGMFLTGGAAVYFYFAGRR